MYFRNSHNVDNKCAELMEVQMPITTFYSLLQLTLYFRETVFLNGKQSSTHQTKMNIFSSLPLSLDTVNFLWTEIFGMPSHLKMIPNTRLLMPKETHVCVVMHLITNIR